VSAQVQLVTVPWISWLLGIRMSTLSLLRMRVARAPISWITPRWPLSSSM